MIGVYPPYGTAPIRCGSKRCKWRGFETDLTKTPDGMWTRNVCPSCGCDSYVFMTEKEIQLHQRKQPRLSLVGASAAPPTGGAETENLAVVTARLANKARLF